MVSCPAACWGPMLSFMTTEGRNAKLEAQVGKVQAVPELVG